MAAAAILNSTECAIFRHDRCVLYPIRNILTKFGEDWSNSNELATVFLIFKMVTAAILNYDHCANFRPDRYVLHRIRNIPTKFGEDWSKSKELATKLKMAAVAILLNVRF